MDKFWLKNYPAGIPETIDVDEFQSIAEVFEHSFEKFADKSAYRHRYFLSLSGCVIKD